MVTWRLTYFLPVQTMSMKIRVFLNTKNYSNIVLHPAGILLGCGFAYAQPDEKFREFFVTGVEYAEQFPCRNPSA